MRLAAALLAALLIASAASPASAQEVECDPGDTEVRSLRFEGNRAFSDLALSEAVVTTPSTFARRALFGLVRFFGTKRCLDRADFPKDLVRLKFFYFNQGYPKARVDTVLRSAGTDRVDVTFRIDEGRPLRLTSFVISGLDTIPGGDRIARNLPLRQGGVFSKIALLRAIDTIETRLRNAGYPTGDVFRSFSTDTTSLTATVELNVMPYARARIGRVDVDIAPHAGARSPKIPDRAARRLLGVEPGDWYSERDLVAAKRRLYQSDAYVQADIATDSLAVGDSVVNLRVTLTENYMYAARTSLGYGTVDCGRAQGTFTDRHFLRGSARLELTGQLSKLGLAEPTDITDAIEAGTTWDPCGTAREDTNSVKLNYYVGATLRTPALWRLRTVPVMTVYRERRSEYKAYLRTTLIGGIASISSERYPRMPITTSYELRYGKTEAAPALFCAVFGRCDEASRDELLEQRRLGVLGWSVIRNRADNPLSPTRGSVARLELRHASPVVYSDRDLQFTKILGDLAWYTPVRTGVLAARVRVGSVFGRDFGSISNFIPQEERLYAGGPNTVRGYRQNELGPVVYRAGQGEASQFDSAGKTFLRAPDTLNFRAVPTGGNSIVVANLEYRFPSPVLPELLQLTTFVDVGEVWNRGRDQLNLAFANLSWTPGVGARVFSPVGAIRLDVGYNTRRLRNGAVYLETPLSQGGALLCVSPTNTIELVTLDPPRQEAGNACPATYRPPQRRGFLERLAFQISIGQAF